MMHLAPTFYFRPLSEPIVLSHYYNITLRNPLPEELPIFQQNIKVLSARLSDKERRRILFTLYPLGNPHVEGTLEEQFIKELSQIWVLAHSTKNLPFEEGLVDYGFLCGYFSDGTYMMNPGGFVGDIKNISPRELLRALKKELPKAAEALLHPSSIIPDIQVLEENASYWDGIFSKSPHLARFIPLATSLRLAHHNHDIVQKLLQFCVASEILLVHNPSNKNDSKMPMNRQFASKLALIRHIMIDRKKEQNLYTPTEMQHFFYQLYEVRSQVTHGRIYSTISKKDLAHYINMLYPTLRLCLELQIKDPLFVEFINKI